MIICDDAIFLQWTPSFGEKIWHPELNSKKQKRSELLNSKQSRFSWKKVKTAAKMNFYTGLSSIEVFIAVFNLIEPYLPSISYWVGPYRMHLQQKSYSKVRQYKNHQFKRKLSQKDEFFLTLMRLRLSLLNKDIADRFGISPTLSSRIFTTWIKVLSKLLGHALITWLPQEAVRSNLPGVFIKPGQKNVVLYLIVLRYL